MDREKFEKEFDKCFFNMDYNGALEVVGAMKYANISKTRYLEMLVYYEQGMFEKVRNTLRNKRLDMIEERELYLASLVELHLFDEFEEAYNTSDPITLPCLYYITAMMIKYGKYISNEHKVELNHPTYFDRRFRWFISYQMVDIYNINEERLLMIESEMDEKDIINLTEKINQKFEMARIKDPIREEIKNFVDKNEHIPVEKILYFPLMYCPPKDKLYSIYKRYDDIFGIINYLELCRRVNYSAVELDAIIEYREELKDAIQKGNMYAVNLMKDLYIDVGYLRRYELNDNGYTVADEIYSILEKYAPYILQEIENHTMDKTIEKVLSPRGVFAYNAAKWQFCNAVGSEYGTRDAGMLCLSYMRIIELEINEKIIIPLCDRFDIKQEYENFIAPLEKDVKDKFIANWKFIIEKLKDVSKEEHRGIELGPIFTLFDLLDDKHFRKNTLNANFAEIIRKELEYILSPEGITALKNGTLAKMVEPKKRESYRNPPAHTRYVGLETALDCRDYVEKELLNLNNYILKG